MRHSEDTRAEAAQSMYARISAKYAAAVAALSFAEPEMLALPEATLRAMAEDARLADYRFALQDLLRQKPHTLTAPEEKLLASFGEVAGVPSEIADALQDADLVFEPAADAAGEQHEVTGSNYILLQTSPDRTLRENSFRSYYKSYRQHINTFAAAYAGRSRRPRPKRRPGTIRPPAPWRWQGRISPRRSTTTLCRPCVPTCRSCTAMWRCASGCSAWMSCTTMTSTPTLTGRSTARYTYEQAQQMVLAAVAPLGADYCAEVRRGLAQRWVDVYPNKGKSGGAYSTGTYDSEPYILMNFTGTLDSVSTLAHEMGHSMHSLLANRRQPPQYANYTLFVAEVASTVNENLMIEQLLENERDPAARLALLNQYLENFKGTVFRQTMFAEFERDAHAMRERGEALSPAALNALYGGLVRDYFGPDLAQDAEYALEWARIPHFYRPFYVYKYATGYSTAVALSEAIRSEGEPAVRRYLEFLSMGGSAYPLDELRHAGVDLAAPAPIEAALGKFARLLDDAEACAAAPRPLILHAFFKNRLDIPGPLPYNNYCVTKGDSAAIRPPKRESPHKKILMKGEKKCLLLTSSCAKAVRSWSTRAPRPLFREATTPRRSSTPL